MEKSIFRFVFRFSRREQILLLLLTLAAFPPLYFSLELPKRIINQAINGKDFPKDFFGFELDQVPYLMALCFAFLGLVLVNGAFKYVINVWKGRLGERMLRRLRYDLYSRVLRFPLPHFRRVGPGEIIPMVTAETEPLGGFVGDAVAQPVFQGGQLLTILAFIMIQDWKLGLAAISLYPFQGWLVPRLQRRVNALAKERVRTMRRVSDRISESISGITEVRAHDASNWQRAQYTALMARIYEIRYEIYRRKFFIKFLNNFLAQLTPFFFYAIGGFLVIHGDLSFGALVAVLAAYKDMSAPWKELLLWYQQKEDARIKYEQVIEQFQP
ncbi:MAG TPA: ABC transporter ATP-binding protein, partial [Caulobacteraceae bacterium]|nr:ABC transporter ATP-binding protein [Caulobacteraceae bacterium]